MRTIPDPRACALVLCVAALVACDDERPTEHADVATSATDARDADSRGADPDVEVNDPSTPTLVGPEGGLVVSADRRATLDVPPGAVSAVTPFSITPVATATLPAADDLVSEAWHLEPSGLEFRGPVFLTVPAAAPGPEDAAAIVRVRDDGARVAMPTTFDADAGTATAELESFSTYAVSCCVMPPGVAWLTSARDVGATTLRWELDRPTSGGVIVVARNGPGFPPLASGWQVIGELPASARTFIDGATLVPESIYYYRVFVRSGPGAVVASAGAPRTTAVLTLVDRPALPLDLRATVTGRDVALTWNPIAVPLVDGFRLSVDVDGQPGGSHTLPVASASFTARDLPPARSYRFTLEALRDGQPAAGAFAWVVIEGFRLDVDPRVVAVRAGEVAASEVTVRRAGGFTAPVALALRPTVGAPAGFTATFTPTASPDVVALAVAVAADVAPGRYNFVVAGESGAAEEVTAFYLDVAPAAVPFDFTLDPDHVTTIAGDDVDYRITLVRDPGFTDPVTMELVAPPDFLAHSMPPTTSGGYLVIGEADPGTYELVFRATSGALVRERTMTIVIGGAPDVDWLVLQNRYSGYVDLLWAPSSFATGYTILRDGVEVRRLPASATTWRDELGVDSGAYYTLQVERGAERSAGRRVFMWWTDPSEGHVFEVYARCRPAAPRCDPPVAVELAGDDAMTLTWTAHETMCAETRLEVSIDGQVEATSDVVRPRETSPEVALTPPAGNVRYALRALGVPGFGCGGSTGALRSWAGTVRIMF